MKAKEKLLLLKDLCERLPYNVIVRYKGHNTIVKNKLLTGSDLDCNMEYYKPYLRPMSSMTEEEREELLNLLFDKEAKYFYIDEEGFIDGKTSDLMKEGFNYPAFCPINIVLYTDWLNSHHFDYRGLIEKGLAIEAPEGMYEVEDHSPQESAERLHKSPQQEQPEMDLEKEVIDWWNGHYCKKDYTFERYNGHYLENSTVIAIAKHFFELGLKAREEEVK